MILLFLACSVHVQGVLFKEQGHLVLAEADGTRHRLGRTPEELDHLEACTLSVDGPKVGRRVLVDEWTVLAAQDGSAPYVGPLRQHGSNLLIEDRNSGAVIILEPESAASLLPYVGQPVMVIGIVVAPQTVRVMGFRVLADVEGVP